MDRTCLEVGSTTSGPKVGVCLFFPDQRFKLEGPQISSLTSFKSTNPNETYEELCLTVQKPLTPVFLIAFIVFVINLLFTLYYVINYENVDYKEQIACTLGVPIFCILASDNFGYGKNYTLYCDTRTVINGIHCFYMDENWQNLGKRWFNEQDGQIFFTKYKKYCVYHVNLPVR